MKARVLIGTKYKKEKEGGGKEEKREMEEKRNQHQRKITDFVFVLSGKPTSRAIVDLSRISCLFVCFSMCFSHLFLFVCFRLFFLL